MKKKTLKTAALLAAAAVFALSACGKDQEESTAAESETAAEAESDTGPMNNSEDAEAIANMTAERPASLGTVELGEYKGVEISTYPPYVITDEDVDSHIEYSVLPNYMASVDEPAEIGDTVNIDYVGKKDGVAFDGGTAEGTDLSLGSGTFIDGFEEGLVGHKKGEEVQLNLTFPENYGNADLAGIDVTFDVTINDVKRIPELTDGLAAEIDPECTTAEQYRQKIKDSLQQNEDILEQQNLSYLAVSKVIEQSEVQASEEAIDWKISDMILTYDELYQQYYGFGLADMIALQGMSLDDFRENMRTSAEQEVNILLVSEAIAARENITADDASIQKFAEDYGMTTEDLRAQYSEEELKEIVTQQMVMDYLVENANITHTDDTAGETATTGAETEASAE